jgi:hypothetical protein
MSENKREKFNCDHYIKHVLLYVFKRPKRSKMAVKKGHVFFTNYLQTFGCDLAYNILAGAI